MTAAIRATASVQIPVHIFFKIALNVTQLALCFADAGLDFAFSLQALITCKLSRDCFCAAFDLARSPFCLISCAWFCSHVRIYRAPRGPGMGRGAYLKSRKMSE